MPKAENMEEGAEKHRLDVGDTNGCRGIECSWNSNIVHITRPQAGKSGIVGGFNTYISILCTGSRVRGMGTYE